MAENNSDLHIKSNILKKKNWKQLFQALNGVIIVNNWEKGCSADDKPMELVTGFCR